MKTMSETHQKQMPDNATERPLVTFALFAYNQEEYIREAVEGAFRADLRTAGDHPVGRLLESDGTYENHGGNGGRPMRGHMK